MKKTLASIATVAAVAQLASGFIGSPLPLRALTKPSCMGRVCNIEPLHMSAEAEEKVEEGTPEVYYASEVTEGTEKTEFTKTFGEQDLEDFSTENNINHGPVDYKNFLDGDGFDGGDGQVGVVGDGSNAMEEFDNKAAIRKKDMEAKLKKSTMVKDSKSRQRNAWGSTGTGYADKLKEEGMVDVNLKGEDMKRIRRQQFENWRNQQEITNMQRAKISEMDRITGKDTARPTWKRGKASYFDEMNNPSVEEDDQSWNKYNVPHTTGKKAVWKREERAMRSASATLYLNARNDLTPLKSKPRFGRDPRLIRGIQAIIQCRDGTEWVEAELTGDEKVEGTITCISVSGRPGHTSLEVRNSVMTFEPFHCSWVGDSDGFSTNPVEGTLNRRNGDATILDVAYLGKGPADNRVGTLVIETEEDKWVYKVEGVMQ